MLSNTLPKVDRQADSYRAIVARADGKPVVFRTLDIGGDKVLHYLRQPKEENPAMGWRAVRMGLDRPALLRTQVRAMLRAAAGQELRMMIPMVSAAEEMDAVHALVKKERAILLARGHEVPERMLDRRHDRGAVPIVRARCADEAGRLRLGRQQRPDAVHVCRRPHECARRQPLSTRCRRRRCAR